MKNVEAIYKQNESKLAQTMIAYLWENMWWLHDILNCVEMRLEGLCIMKKQWETLNIQNPNPRRWSVKDLWAPMG